MGAACGIEEAALGVALYCPWPSIHDLWGLVLPLVLGAVLHRDLRAESECRWQRGQNAGGRGLAAVGVARGVEHAGQVLVVCHDVMR